MNFATGHVDAYLVELCGDMDLALDGSNEERRKAVALYLLPLLVPFAQKYGVGHGDLDVIDDPSPEEVEEEVDWLWREEDFTGYATLWDWCEKRGHKALCWLTASCDTDFLSCPYWLD